jgi:hypothetical protein
LGENRNKINLRTLNAADVVFVENYSRSAPGRATDIDSAARGSMEGKIMYLAKGSRNSGDKIIKIVRPPCFAAR